MTTTQRISESAAACTLNLECELRPLSRDDWRPPSNVIIATDGSVGSDAAVTLGRRLAARAGQDAELITVFERPIAYEVPLVAGPSEMEIDLAAKQSWWQGIEEQRRRIAPGAGRWPVTFEEGRPARVIADVAGNRANPLIVIGSGAHGLFEWMTRGELALDVIRQGAAPVLAVHPDQPLLPTTALVALDFTPASIEAAHLALHLLGERGTLYLVHASGREENGRTQVSSAPDEKTVGLLFEEVQRTMSPPPNVSVEKVVLAGHPARSILAFATEQAVDVVACGMHGYSTLKRLLMGSVSTRILRSAPCSVLVAPPRPDVIGWC